jgi:inhibitor of KinA sporulation pathway (predicted exonuclease)
MRSLAKELRQLEKQRQDTATPSPPPAVHADPDERTAAAATSARTTSKKISHESTTLFENDSTRHAASPPAETEEALSSASSSPSTNLQEGGAANTALTHASGSSHHHYHNDDDRVKANESASTSSSDEEDVSRGGLHRRKKCTSGLFALGGSRFDILVHGTYSGGTVCRKSEVRKATKVCSSGRDALQRSPEDVTMAGEGAEAAAGAGGEAFPALSTPPPPPLGTSCCIPTRFPFKRLLPQPFSHILVCDFEATCASGSVHYPHEIIEFPVVVLDTATLRIVAEFHRYVRPVRNPKLTEFCTELTGITQKMVDQADTLPVVVEQFQQWLEQEVYPLCAMWMQYYGPDKLSHNLKSEQRRFVYDDRTDQARANAAYEAMICVATDGPWDMRRFMHECSVMRDGVAFPPLCYRYINVRHSYSDHFKCRQVKLTHMLKKLSMSFEGRRHSGIDDTRNITRVLAELMARGYRVHHVSTIKYSHRGGAFLESNQAAQELLSEYGECDQTHTARHGNPHNGAAKRNACKR